MMFLGFFHNEIVQASENDKNRNEIEIEMKKIQLFLYNSLKSRENKPHYSECSK